ncbi:SRPBCC family protein [Ensifer sp. MJa1]|uniref:SRPBCC family protein n=1 Tax=Ensifer sp. MJa1 TaxID=2919888 RepID=UPI0030093446
MCPKPTGHVRGNDLILIRTFSAPIDGVWTSVTKSEKTALWFGRWEGEAGPGKTVRLQLLHEKGQPWTDVLIEDCEAPRRLVVVMKDDYGEWRIELTFTQTDDTTELRLVQRLSDPKLAGDVGPGWEYYLDMLVAAYAGKALPSFADYYPSQKAHYLEGA